AGRHDTADAPGRASRRHFLRRVRDQVNRRDCFPVMLAFAAVAYRRILSAIVSGAILTLALAAFSAILYLLYGTEFIFQTFVFHFMKGRDTVGGIAAYPRMILDVLVPLFVLGGWRIWAD